MKDRIRLALTLALLVSAPAAGEYDSEKALAWVEHETPKGLLEKDLAVGRKRFFIYCGIGCDLRGVDEDSYELCYSRVATAEEMAGTTDNPRSPHHEELLEIAWRFVHEYNALLAKRLTALGLSDCPADGSPGGWLAPLKEVVRRIDEESTVSVLPSRYFEADLGADLTATAHWAEGDDDRVCWALAKGGLRRRYSFKIVQPGAPARRFVCDDGAVLRDAGESPPS